jgi:hypothetical protein
VCKVLITVLPSETFAYELNKFILIGSGTEKCCKCSNGKLLLKTEVTVPIILCSWIRDSHQEKIVKDCGFGGKIRVEFRIQTSNVDMYCIRGALGICVFPLLLQYFQTKCFR